MLYMMIECEKIHKIRLQTIFNLEIETFVSSSDSLRLTKVEDVQTE